MAGSQSEVAFSIPAKGLLQLLNTIETEFREKEGVKWDGYSASLKAFFEKNDLNPCVHYAAHYRRERHTIAVSYVWSVTSLYDISGLVCLPSFLCCCSSFNGRVSSEECNLPDYEKDTFFIDVLVVFQRGLTSEDVVSKTFDNYGSKVLLFYCALYFTRAWCCLEIAISTSRGCELIVLGSGRNIEGKDFFNEMNATVKSDIDLIRDEICKLFEDARNFNRIVSNAMVSLFVASSKNVPFNLYGNVPRHQREKWKPVLVPEQPPVRCRDRNLDWAILTGRPTSDASLASEDRSIRVFLSSTLTDSVLERNFIAYDVEPFLQLHARNHGLEFMFSDMCKGTREDVDMLPPKVLLTELHNCQTTSAGLNYVLIIGNKYGIQPLPDHVPQQEFDAVVGLFDSDDAKRIAREWYRLDENVLGVDGKEAPQYVMKKVNQLRDFRPNRDPLQAEFRRAALSLWPDVDIMKLRKRKNLVPGSRDDRIKSYFLSSLEIQAGRGILAPEGQDELKRIHVFHRQFNHRIDLQDFKSPALGAFYDMPDGNIDVDAAQKLQELHDVIAPALCGSDCIKEYGVPLLADGIDPDNSQHAEYLMRFLDDLTQVGISTIKDAARRLAVEPDPSVEEIRHHLKFAADRAKRFHNTKSSLDALKMMNQYLSGPGGRAFVLWGPSGGGKTYVMAKAAQDRSNDEPVLIRFLGTSAKSADVFSLLENVCENLRILSHGESAYKGGGESKGLSECPKSYEELRVYFSDALANWAYVPITIFLDGVDQLNGSNSGLNLAWLPVVGLSRNVHLVVSTLPDEPTPEVGLPFRCLSILCKKLVPGFKTPLRMSDLEAVKAVCNQHPQLFIGVDPLKNAVPLFSHLLKLNGRRATQRQTDAIMDVVKGSDKNQTPLVVTILAYIVAKLHSFDEVPKFTLDSASSTISVRQIIVSFCHRLQHDHGKKLVSHSLSYITVPEQGVTEAELIDILSIDDVVLAEAYPWWVTHKRRMPSAPVTLLLTELKPFLSRRVQRNGGELLTWYHRQFWEAVEDHYLSLKRSNNREFILSRLQTLKEYFLGKWAEEPKALGPELFARVKHFNKDETRAVRSVRDQPLQLGGKFKWHADAEYNTRRCVELMPILLTELKCMVSGEYASTSMKLYESLKIAEKEMCSVDGVVARSMVGLTFKFMSQCSEFIGYVEQAMKISEVHASVNAQPIDTDCMNHFYRWIRRDAHDFKSPLQIVLTLLRQPAASKARKNLILNKTRVEGFPYAILGGNLSDFDSVLSILKGHTEWVRCVCWSPDHGNQIASCSDDRTIIVWDSNTGDQIAKIEGLTAGIRCVAWSPDGDQIASGLYDHSIIIWDAKTGDKIWTAEGYDASCCSFPFLSRRRGHGHGAAVTSVEWSPLGDHIASASSDKTIIIWDAKTGEQISTLKGHTDEVRCVSWSPNGDQIASASDDKTVITWDAKTGEQISTLKEHTRCVTSVAWRPQRSGHPGDQIASGSADNTIIIWDAKTGELVSTLQGHTTAVMSVAWRAGGDRIASAADDKTIIIWDAKTGEQVSTLKGHTSAVNSVAWRPGGDQIASGSTDNTIIIWDAKTGEQVSTQSGHSGSVYSVAWRPGGDQIASTSWDKSIIIWDAKSGEQASTLKGHTDGVLSVAWRPGSDQIASGSRDETIIIWDAKTGEQISKLKGHTGWVTSVAWRPGGNQIASSSVDKTIIIWDARSGQQVLTLKGHTAGVYSVAWRPGGDQIASGSVDNTIIIWDAKTGQQISTLKGHTSYVNNVAWSPWEDQIASASEDKTIIIWDVKTGEQISTLKGHTHGVTSIAWRPGDDQIASGSYDNSIMIWDAKTGEKISTLKGHSLAVRSVAWHPEGNQIASASADNTIIIWDAKIDEQISTLKGHTGKVNGLSWCPNGDQIASASDDKTVIVWDAKTGEQISTLKGHTECVMSLAWCPGDNEIASGSFDKTIIVWDAKTGDKISTLKGHSDRVQSVTWNPSGSQIVSGSNDKTVIIWDAKTGKQVSTLKGHSDEVYSVGWSSTGERIASASADKTIIIWDAKSGDLVSTLRGHTGTVLNVAWSPSGHQVASASGDNTVIVWDAGTGAILSQLTGHSDVVLSVAWSTFAEQVISGSRDKMVIVWDSKTSKEVLKLEGHTSAITSVACSVKRQVASGASDGTVIVWDGQSGERKTTLVGHPGSVQGVVTDSSQSVK